MDKPIVRQIWFKPVFAAAAAFALLSGPFLARQLWFDEALTIMNFALMRSPVAIYGSYPIPNNHLLFSILLHYWIKAVPSWMPLDIWCRLPSFLFGIGILIFMYRRFGNFCGRRPLLVALAALALGTPFLIYATAVRGYMAGAFFAMLGCGYAMDIASEAGSRPWFRYALASLAAVLTVPSNLVAAAAGVLVVLPMLGRKFYVDPRFYGTVAIPPAMLILGYLPIWRQFVKAARLGEGWSDGLASLRLLYAAVLYAFAAVAVPAVTGAATRTIRRFRWAVVPRLAVWLLPVPAALLLSVAPFPRVYLVLFPFFALLIARGLRDAEAMWLRTGVVRQRIFAVAMVLIVVWGGLSFGVRGMRSAVSARLSDQLGDDYIYGYYLRPEHDPSAAARELDKMKAERVYLSFLADPWAIMFYDFFSGVRRQFVFDGPRGPVKELSPGAAVVLNRAERPRDLERRFGIKLVPVAETPGHLVFRAAE